MTQAKLEKAMAVMWQKVQELEARMDKFVKDSAILTQHQQELVLDKILEQQLESDEGFES